MRAIRMALAVSFVFLAGFNVWSMLGGGFTHRQSQRLWTQLHRVVGYTFIALFAILCYFMLLRLKGSPEELTPRVAIHAGLALALAPLLFVKVIVARYQRSQRGVLAALGISIFAAAFTLVALNLAVHFLQLASTEKVSARASETFIAVVLAFASLGFVLTVKHTPPNADERIGVHNGDPRGEEACGAEPIPLTLAHIETQTHDAKTLRFLLPLGRKLDFRPGQFLTFECMIEGTPVSRSYSICSSPTQTSHIEITPKRLESGCVSKFLNDRAQLGLVVNARGPFGKFYLDETRHDRIVLLAAGSGITPMISMMRYIDALCLPIDCTLIYCARKEEDVFFLDELHVLQNRFSHFHLAFVLSKSGPAWSGWKGHLRREVLDLEVEKPLESTFFLCGPPAFMSLARELLRQMGIDQARILQESFGGALAGKSHPSSDPGACKVSFVRSMVASNAISEQTLLECAEAHGVPIPSGCRHGDCGTCATRLLSGKVKMEAQEALGDEQLQRGYILPCVSRPLTDVALDA